MQYSDKIKGDLTTAHGSVVDGHLINITSAVRCAMPLLCILLFIALCTWRLTYLYLVSLPVFLCMASVLVHAAVGAKMKGNSALPRWVGVTRCTAKSSAAAHERSSPPCPAALALLLAGELNTHTLTHKKWWLVLCLFGCVRVAVSVYTPRHSCTGFTTFPLPKTMRSSQRHLSTSV